MNCEAIAEKISGYLDLELTQQESQQVRLHLENCPACRKIHAEMKQMKEQMGKLSYPKTDLQVLNEIENDLFARRSMNLGWFLILLCLFIVAGLTLIDFVTAESMPLKDKLFIALCVLGPLSLLAAVVRQRFITYKNDKYRKVKL